MTYPFDQIGALGKANAQFAAELAQILREGGERYLQASGAARAAVFDQFREVKPGTVPAFKADALTAFFGEIEECRKDSTAKLQSAFDAWQGYCKDALSKAVDGQQNFAGSLTGWLQPSVGGADVKADLKSATGS